MKSLASIVFSSVVLMATAVGAFGQEVAPAISLGDPMPAFEADPNVVQVSGCQGCQAKLAFQACCEPSKGCTSGCKETIVTVNCPGDCKAPHCACAAKPTPCKACEVHKHFRHVAATPCATCAAPTPCKTCAAPAPAPCTACKPAAPAPCTACKVATPAPCTTCKPAAPAPCVTCAPAPCKTCSAPTPAPCTACETKKIHHHAPACTTCSAPAPAPCATCAKPAPCAAPCKVAAAPCDTCDPCKTHAHKAAHSRPILDALKGLFNGSGHQHHAPAATPCTTCTAPAAAQPAATAQQIPATAPTTLPAQPVSYEAPQPAPVPAAYAPYAGQSTFSTAVPPAEVR